MTRAAASDTHVTDMNRTNGSILVTMTSSTVNAAGALIQRRARLSGAPDPPAGSMSRFDGPCVLRPGTCASRRQRTRREE